MRLADFVVCLVLPTTVASAQETTSRRLNDTLEVQEGLVPRRAPSDDQGALESDNFRRRSATKPVVAQAEYPMPVAWPQKPVQPNATSPTTSTGAPQISEPQSPPTAPPAGPLRRPAPAAIQPERASRLEWYKPAPDDANRPWNASKVGFFDPSVFEPWDLPTGIIALTFSSRSVAVSDLNNSNSGVPGATISTSQIGVLFGNGRIFGGLSAGDFSVTSGLPSNMSSKSFLVAFLSGTKVIHDFGEPDVRLGVSLPEVVVRVTHAEAATPFATGLRYSTLVGFEGCVSLVGLRASFTDFIVAELRLFGADLSMWIAGDAVSPSSTLGGFSLGLFPEFRLGVAY